MLIALAIILIALIFLVCGDRGARSIITTAVNAVILLIALLAMFRGLPPLLVTAAAGTASAAFILFYQNEVNKKSIAAFLAALLVLAVLLPLVFFIVSKGNAAGFNSEQYELTDSNGYTRNVAISMPVLLVCVMIFALLGTVIDTAVAVTTSVYEIYASSPDISLGRLTASAFEVGKSILNTSIHTIFYIYIAEYMTLMIQYIQDSTAGYVLNSKSLACELLSVTVTGLGCCLAVPAAILIAVPMFRKPALEKE